MFFSNVSIYHPVSVILFLVRYARYMNRISSDLFIVSPVADCKVDVKHVKKDEAKQMN